MTKIGINAHLLSGREGYRRAGIHHYIRQVIAHLPVKAWLEYIVFTRRPELVTRPGVTAHTTHIPTERRLSRILWEQTALPVASARLRLDLLHSMAFVLPYLSPCPALVTVYDLSFMHYPESFPAAQRRYLAGQTRRSCRAARRVITISESGREDVHHFFGVPRERIGVVRPGVDENYHPRPEDEVAAFRMRKGLPAQFILHVGTLQPRKNIPTLIEAMARLNRPEIPLLLVGGKGWLYDQIFAQVEALGLKEQVRFTGYVPDEELPLWYSAAAALVFPSVYEGFGLPVIEAMACGTPVIAARASAIPEAAGEAGLLFDPDDAVTLTGQIGDVLGNSDLAATMAKRGLIQANQFSWDQSGRDMADNYLAAL